MVFSLHFIFQIATQALSFVAIGGCIYIDNHHFNEDANTDDSIYVSGLLWGMIVAGYILPLLGFFSFFLVTYYWAQEFPIAFLLDMISLWRMDRGSEDFVCQQPPRDELMSEITKFSKEVEPAYEVMHNRRWDIKFTYPFRNPNIVVLCMIYTVFAVVFWLFSIFNDDASLDFLGWLVYFCVATVLGVIANAYAFAVATFWTTIIIANVYALEVLLTIVNMSPALIIIIILTICKHAKGGSNNESEHVRNRNRGKNYGSLRAHDNGGSNRNRRKERRAQQDSRFKKTSTCLCTISCCLGIPGCILSILLYKGVI